MAYRLRMDAAHNMDAPYERRRVALASYCAVVAMPDDVEIFLNMGTSFDDALAAAMLRFADLSETDRQAATAIRFKRWRGVADAGEWVFCAQRPTTAFLKHAEVLNSPYAGVEEPMQDPDRE